MITSDQFGAIEALFDYYKRELFGGQLNDCLLNLSRKNGSMGFMAPFRWKSAGNKPIHEISINPDTFEIDDEEFHRTLIHEMCHLWQTDFGTPSRKCYHNKEWAEKMISIGLMPSHTGEPGGRITGQQMNDYTIESGLFIQKFREIQQKGGSLRLPYFPIKYPESDRKERNHRSRNGDGKMEGWTVIMSEEVKDGDGDDSLPNRAGVKFKYTCACSNNIWGKYGLQITCNVCLQQFVLQEK